MELAAVCRKRSERHGINYKLKKKGYDVTYEEFDGRHEMTTALVEKAFDLFIPKRS